MAAAFVVVCSAVAGGSEITPVVVAVAIDQSAHSSADTVRKDPMLMSLQQALRCCNRVDNTPCCLIVIEGVINKC